MKMNRRGLMQSKLIIVIIGLVLLFFIGVGIIYNIYTSNLSPEEIACEYEDFDHIEDYGELSEKPEDYFVLYIYSPVGEDSEEVKGDICNFALSNEEGIKVYFAEYPLASLPNTVTPPAVMIVENAQIVTTYRGVSGVYEFLDDMETNRNP